MAQKMYSVEEVADLLGLHVRTVRGYIRDGRLNAVRIGKQYRIAPADLEALTGRPPASAGRAEARTSAEVSSIVDIDGVDRAAADRLSTLVLAGANTGGDQAHRLRVQTLYDAERRRLKVVVLGGAAATADLLRTLDAVLEGDNDLLRTEKTDG
ncbi:helix-turn-helix domain-containing protein [Actinomadura algeriensis]|uniref:Excisionase family DNA binding protein n=1 Tax=Actinomadura algeriensis TaxID=1679523 RepID=A0ABR9JPI2_9ACTN|nr:helix-turn-helix domain-containing protein [Actinomadura algeriensis]MBE1532323.1 excisionase family DNA binding protein [Actinomadura algeriensis]